MPNKKQPTENDNRLFPEVFGEDKPEKSSKDFFKEPTEQLVPGCGIINTKVVHFLLANEG